MYDGYGKYSRGKEDGMRREIKKKERREWEKQKYVFSQVLGGQGFDMIYYNCFKNYLS